MCMYVCSVFDDGKHFNHEHAHACVEPCGPAGERLCEHELPNLRLWFGSAGMVACMHYDTSYNMHTGMYVYHDLLAAVMRLDWMHYWQFCMAQSTSLSRHPRTTNMLISIQQVRI